MELVCDILDPNETPIVEVATNSSREVEYTQTNNTYDPINFTLQQAHLDPWNFYDWNKHVIVPSLCVFGIIGNVINLIILGKRTKEGLYTVNDPLT